MQHLHLSSSRRSAMALLWTAAALMTAPGWAPAQAGPSTRPAAMPTEATVQAQLARLEQAEGLDDAVRTQAIDACKQTLAQLQAAATWQAKAIAYETAAREAPAKLVQLKKELDAPASQPASVPAGVPLLALEQMLAKATGELAAAKKDVTDLEAEPNRRAQRRLEVAELITAANQRLDEVARKLGEKPRDRSAELAAALVALWQAQREAIHIEIDAYGKEVSSYDAERELISRQRDLAAARLSRLEEHVKGLQQAVNSRRQEEAAGKAEAAREAAARVAQAHPGIRDLAEENAKLAELRTGPEGLAVKIATVSQRLDGVTAELTGLQEGFKSLTEKAKVIEGTATFGMLLRKQQAELPDVRQYRRRSQQRQEEISDVQLRLIELDDRRAALADLDAAARTVMARLKPPPPPAEREEIAATVRQLLQARREALDALIKDYNAYFGKLVDLDAAARTLTAKTSELSGYIDERVLWIRSSSVLAPSDVSRAAEAVRWLLGGEAWAEVGTALWANLRRSPLTTPAVVLAVLALLAVRRRLGRRLALLGDTAKGQTSATFFATVQAALLTFLLALTIPVFGWYVAWRLYGSPSAGDHAKAIATGVRTSASILATFWVLIEIFRANGLAEAHFRWPVANPAAVRKSLMVAACVLAVMGFMVAAIEWQGDEAWRNSLGRIALLAALVTIAVMAQRLLRPSGPVSLQAVTKARTGWLGRPRSLLYPLAVALPLLLAILVVLGYYHTALHLTERLTVTGWLLLCVLIGSALVEQRVRDLLHRLAARRDRHRASARASADRSQPDETAEPAPVPEDRLQAVSAQAHRLLRWVAITILIVGGWRIWADSLPALGALQRVELWTRTVKTPEPTATPDGQVSVQTVERVVPVTLADASLAVLAVILTVVAARSVPGFLEIVVLQRLRLDAGARYAFGAICMYAISVVGVLLAFRLIGVGWSSVQWLVAAMTVGLAFGLQEIFANFVSGLIILFERPIRIGDTVTVGETAGTVTRIRIRATTITDWDRKELIVPNKEFVTGRLVNWSLSDKVLRVILRVGIAYGSDTELAEKILYEKAREHPLVLKEPAPLVLFTEFGDNSLNFELRVYISGIEHYLKVGHGLNMAIDRAFRDAGITIAFPQRDTHLNTLEPLEIRIVPTDDVPKASRDGHRTSKGGR